MAGLLYFIPGHAKAVKLSELRELGLGHAFDGDSFACAMVLAGGPGGERGTIVGDPKRINETKLKYLADQQCWRKVPKHEAWVGYYKDDQPTPADLQRDDMIGGHMVELGDGRQYMVPLARAMTTNDDGEPRDVCVLPQEIAVDDEGEWIIDGVSEKYAALWAIATRCWDARMQVAENLSRPEDEPKEEVETVTLAYELDEALQALAMNYRVSKAEVSLLKLFTESIALAVLDAVIDWPTWMAWSKKKLGVEAASVAAT